MIDETTETTFRDVIHLKGITNEEFSTHVLEAFLVTKNE